jgi:hypothetical protein
VELRQIALVAHSLGPAVDDLTGTLGIDVAYNDPGVGIFGLENAVMPVGRTFLEVVSPVEEGTAAGRYLDRRHGDGGYMVILQVEDLDAHRRRVEGEGIRIAWEGSTAGWSGIHLHPADVGAAILSFDVAEPAGDWPPAGPSWREHVRGDAVDEIVAAELQSDDADKLAERWSTALGRPVGEGRTIALDRGTLRFVPATDGRPDGIGGIDIHTTDRSRAGEEHLLCGTRVRLV